MSGGNYGGLLGILPSDTSGSSKQNGTTVSSGGATGTQSQTSAQSGSSSSSNTYDPNAKSALDSALNSSTYSKGAAIGDAQGAMDAAVQSSLRAGMPGISSAAKGSGGYNSTTEQLLDNNLTASASAAGASVVLGNIQNYAQIGQGNINAATNAVQATKGNVSTNTTAGTQTGTSSSTNANASTTTGVTANQSGSKGAIGDVLNGGGPSGTVICTQLWRDGHLSERVYVADNRYVRKHFSRGTINGYRLWAVPFVLLMRRNHVAYNIGKYFGTKWSNHCAAHYIGDVDKNLIGRLLIWTLVPLCWMVGSIIPDVQYLKLYQES